MTRKWTALAHPLDRQGIALAGYILDSLAVDSAARNAILSSPRAMNALIDIYLSGERENAGVDEAETGNQEPRDFGADHPFDRVAEIVTDPAIANRADLLLSYASVLKTHPGMPFAAYNQGRLDLPDTLLRMVGWAYEYVTNGATWVRDQNGNYLLELSKHKAADVLGTDYGGKIPSVRQLKEDIVALDERRTSPEASVLWYLDHYPSQVRNLRQELYDRNVMVRSQAKDPLDWRLIDDMLHRATNSSHIPKPLGSYNLSPITKNWFKHTSDLVMMQYLTEPSLIEAINRVISNKPFMKRYHRALRTLVLSGNYNSRFFGSLDDLRRRKDLFITLERSIMKPGAGIEAEIAALALLEKRGRLVAPGRIVSRRVLPNNHTPTTLKETFEIDGVIHDQNGIQILEVKALSASDFSRLMTGIDRAKEVAEVLHLPVFMLASFPKDVTNADLGILQKQLRDAIGTSPVRVGYFSSASHELMADNMKILYEPANIPVVSSVTDPAAHDLVTALIGREPDPFLSEKAKLHRRASIQRVSSTALKHDIGSVSSLRN